MEGLTVGEIAGGVALVAGTITGIAVFIKLINKWATDWLQENLRPINDKIDRQMYNSKKFRLGYYQDFLANFMSDLEKGVKKSEVEMENFYKNYDIYTSPSYQGNTFIKEKYEQLKKSGKL